MASRRKSHLPNRIDVKIEETDEDHIDVGDSPKIGTSVEKTMDSVKCFVNELSNLEDRLRFLSELQQKIDEMKHDLNVLLFLYISNIKIGFRIVMKYL